MKPGGEPHSPFAKGHSLWVSGPSCPTQNNVLKRHDRSDSWRKIPISLIDFGGNQDSGGKLLKTRVRAA